MKSRRFGSINVALCCGVLVAVVLLVTIGARFHQTVNSSLPHEWQRSMSAAVTLLLSGTAGDDIAGQPIRDVWALALTGEYSAVKETYLNAQVEENRPVFDEERDSFVSEREPADSKTARFVRWACIDALAAVSSDAAIAALVDILQTDPCPDPQLVSSIFDSGNQQGIEAIGQLASGGRVHVREAIAAGLARSQASLDHPLVVSIVCSLLQGGEEPISMFHAAQLVELPVSDSELRAEVEASLRTYVGTGEGKEDELHRKRLLAVFLGGESPEAHEIVRELMARGTDSPHNPGYGLLHLLPEDEAIGHAIKLATSADEFSRAAAAYAAARMATRSAEPIVERLARDESRKVRAAVARGLVNPFEGREEVLLRLARDPEFTVREACLEPLSTLHTKAAQGMLISLLWTEYYFNEEREKSWRYNSGVSPNAFTDAFMRAELDDLSRSRRAELRRLAASFLGQHRLDGFEDALLDLATDDSLMVRCAACRALYRTNPNGL
ncbi:MAG: hypothetical protein JW759_10045 [Candidatus Coatesbacteria bacterium]|nr:hypothetical protein [Candidatus Coatesbacteria bacterium]